MTIDRLAWYDLLKCESDKKIVYIRLSSVSMFVYDKEMDYTHIYLNGIELPVCGGKGDHRKAIADAMRAEEMHNA